jgi:hypothetical protein
MIMAEDIILGLFTATIVVMVWSILYRESIFYRIIEHAYTGVTFGYLGYRALDTLYTKTFIPLTQTWSLSYILVTLFGIILCLRLIPQLRWLARWSLAVLTGVSIGLGARGALSAQIIKQTNLPSFWVPGDLSTSIGNIVLFLFTLGCLVYFIYTREHKGAQGAISQIGRLSLMVTFGVVMGTFYSANVAMPISQIPKLVTYPGYFITIIAAILIAYDYYRQSTVSAE